MAYSTSTTKITSATSAKSKQATAYQYPSGNGVVITGSSVSSQTTAYLGVVTPGSPASYTQASGGSGFTITGITYLDSNNVVTNANAVSTSGGNVLISGTGFTSPCFVYINNSLVTNVVSNSTAIIATAPSGVNGRVTCAVFNSSNGGGAISGNTIQYSGAPNWVSSGAVSSYNDVASNIELSVSGDATLTYSLQAGSGSLPTGITLLSSGYLTGTATGYTSDTVVTFTLVVSDNEGQASQQAFTYTVFIGDTYFKQTSLLLSADTANTFISDSSTNNFLVSRFGDTRPSRFSPYWPGGWSAWFDGSGDYLELPTSTAYDLGSVFTIECWIYALDNSTGGILHRGYYSTNGTSWAGLAFSFRLINPKLRVYFYGVSAATEQYIDSTDAVPLGKWTHVAAVRNGTTGYLFFNGILQGTVTGLNTPAASTQTLRVGVWDLNFAGTPTSYYYTGYISNVRLLKGTALYTANFTPSTTALTTVANTSLLTLRDSILADDSPNNFTITRNSDTRLTTFSPFNNAPYTLTANSNSVYFDGTGDYLSIANNSAFNITSGSTDSFICEAWVYFTKVAASMSIIDNGGLSGTSFQNWSITLNASSQITIQWGNSAAPGSTIGTLASSTVPVVGRWYHLALVKTNADWSLFIDGTRAVTYIGLNTAAKTSATALYIGYGITTSAGGATFAGYISNLRIYKGATGSAPYAATSSTITVPTTPLTAITNTNLLTCQSTTVIDNSTNNFTLTVNGNPNVSIVNPFGENVSTISNYTWSANSYSASGYFDGTGDYLTVADNAALQVGSSNFTFEAWVYHSTLPSSGNYKTLWSKRPTLAGFGGSCLVIDSSGNYLFFVASNSSTWGLSGSSTGHVVSLNNWTHLAMVRSGNNLILYKNGIAGTTVTLNFTVYDSGAFTLMAGAADGGQALDGYISNFRLLKGTALYTGTFIPPAAPLTAVTNTSILTLQTDIGSNSVQFVDQSPQNNLITRNGNASQGTFSPLVPSTWSAYFDGTGDYLTTPSNTAFAFGTGDFTIEGWFYFTGTISTYQRLWWFSTDTDNGEISSSTVRFGGTGQTNITGSTLTTSRWYHIAYTRQSSNGKLFLDGVQVGVTTTNSYDSSSARTLTIFATAAGANPATGYVSNFRVLKGTALYTANFTPSTTTIGPVANTSLLTLREPILADNSGNNFTITRNGDTKIVPFGPFSPQTVTPDSYSYRFSNASDYISTTNSNLALGTNDWTIESWVYPRFTANSGIFQISNVQYGLTNSNLNTVALGFSSGNKAIVRVANATYTSTGTSITANAWTHLALVKSSSVSKLYINGTLDSTIGTSGSITDTVNYTGTTNIAIGGYGSTSALANAYISNFRVVSNSAVYTSNFTVNVGPLTAVNGTTLLTCQANTIVDSSAANLTITANANVTPSKFNPFDETVTVGQTYSGASAGGSAYFDGSGDSLSSGSNNLSMQFRTNPYTIEFWVYQTARNSSGAYYVGGTGSILQIWILNDGTVRADFAGVGTIATTTTVVNLNQWSHIAVVRTSTASNSLKIYINGILSATGTDSNDHSSTTSTINIGRTNNNDTYVVSGYISNLRILNGTALYTSNFVPPAAPALPTTANTSLLLNFTNSGVVDATGRNVLETVNDARVVTSTYKYGSGSYYFDGTTDYFTTPSDEDFNFGIGDFTIECWVNWTTVAADKGLISRYTSSTGWALRYSGLGLQFSDGDSSLLVYSTTPATNTWYHYAVTRSGTNLKMFIDGVVVASATNSTSLNASNPLYIGSLASNLWFFNGYLDDIRITKGYARYTANFTAPTAPFVTK